MANRVEAGVRAGTPAARGRARTRRPGTWPRQDSIWERASGLARQRSGDPPHVASTIKPAFPLTESQPKSSLSDASRAYLGKYRLTGAACSVGDARLRAERRDWA